MRKEKNTKSQNPENDEMLPEYDFRGGARGKHLKAYRRGHTVTIHKSDGTTQVQHFKLEDGAVMLEPDVWEYFPDSETVNNALRGLISLLPKKSKAKIFNLIGLKSSPKRNKKKIARVKKVLTKPFTYFRSNRLITVKLILFNLLNRRSWSYKIRVRNSVIFQAYKQSLTNASKPRNFSTILNKTTIVLL